MMRTTTIADWLDGLGLGQYAETFANNHIDFAVLPDLTEDDLNKLGVSLGHGKKLLRAIEALTELGSGTSKTVSPAPPEMLSSVRDREAELRQITVMFCDLVGSSELSEKMDPEDVQKLID
jgi:hypothetical protein